MNIKVILRQKMIGEKLLIFKIGNYNVLKLR